MSLSGKESLVQNQCFLRNSQSLILILPNFYIEDTNNKILLRSEECYKAYMFLFDDSLETFSPVVSTPRFMIELNEEVRNTGESLSVCILNHNNAGTLTKLECIKSPYINNSGKLLGVMTVLKEIPPEQLDDTSAGHYDEPVSLLSRFSDGHCKFEYFANGEGRFLELSDAASELLGLVDIAINRMGITGCISPTICDEDRVNIARAFKAADSGTKKLSCLFRYQSKGALRQCKFIAVRDTLQSDKLESHIWHGIFIDLGLDSNQTESSSSNPFLNRVNEGQEPLWVVYKYHQILVDCFTLNLINFKISQESKVDAALENAEYIVFMLDDLINEYGEQWYKCIKNYKVYVVIITPYGDDTHYYNQSIVLIPSVLLYKINFTTVFSDTEIPSNHKIALESCNFKLLIAEDNKLNQFLIKNQLEQLGCTVTLASNGKIALETLNMQNFDAVITDCHMPEMDGFELAKQIRSSTHSAIKSLPIIGLTADNSKDVSLLANNTGINRILFKPYKLIELHEILLDLVQGSPVEPIDCSQLRGEFLVPELSQWVGVFGTRADAITMARIFYETLESDLSDLAIGMRNNDTLICKKILHRIKGSIVMVKMDSITIQIEECEEVISVENRIDHRLNVLVNNLVRLNKVVCTWLD